MPQYNFDEDDKAAQLYTKWQLDGNLPIKSISGKLGDAPFVVIGDFAYTSGDGGYLYMTPIDTDGTPTWSRTIQIPDDVASWDFPLNQLKRVLADVINIADVMVQHGIRVHCDR